MIKKLSLLVLSAILATGCAYNHVKKSDNASFSDIKKVCFETNQTQNGNPLMEDLINKSLSDLGIETQIVLSKAQTDTSDCSHYLKYSARTKKNRDEFKRLHISFFRVIHNADSYDRVGEISTSGINKYADPNTAPKIHSLISQMVGK